MSELTGNLNSTFGHRPPSKSERDSARELNRVLKDAAKTNQKLVVVDPSGKPIEVALAPALTEILAHALEHLENGDAVSIQRATKVLTTQMAADILNVPKQHVVDLVSNGGIEYNQTRRHCRITAEDLFRYKNIRDSNRAAALDELALIDSEFI